MLYWNTSGERRELIISNSLVQVALTILGRIYWVPRTYSAVLMRRNYCEEMRDGAKVCSRDVMQGWNILLGVIVVLQRNESVSVVR